VPEDEPEDDGGHQSRSEDYELVRRQGESVNNVVHARWRRPDPRREQSLVDCRVAGEIQVQEVVADGHDQPLHQVRQCNQQTDCAHDAGVDRCLAESAEQQAVQCDAH
jgi:hypothetical protein